MWIIRDNLSISQDPHLKHIGKVGFCIQCSQISRLRYGHLWGGAFFSLSHINTLLLILLQIWILVLQLDFCFLKTFLHLICIFFFLFVAFSYQPIFALHFSAPTPGRPYLFVDTANATHFPQMLFCSLLQVIFPKTDLLLGLQKLLPLPYPGGLFPTVFFIFACMLSCSVVSDFCDPMDCRPPGYSVHGIFQARTVSCQKKKKKEYQSGGCHFLLLGIFLNQKSNLCLLHCLHWQVDSSPLSHQRSSFFVFIHPRIRKSLSRPVMKVQQML